jgi:hypothetical protein
VANLLRHLRSRQRVVLLLLLLLSESGAAAAAHTCRILRRSLLWQQMLVAADGLAARLAVRQAGRAALWLQ